MSFTEKLDEKSLQVFNNEHGGQAEFIYSVSNQIFRMADMKARGINFVHLYDEGCDLDLDMGIYLFEQLYKFWNEPSHEWFRGSVGLANWAQAHASYKGDFKQSAPEMMTSIARKKELREKVDVNFDGRVSMLEFLCYQYNASPKSLIERSLVAADLPAEVRAALAALADVQKRVNEYEAEKHRLEEESKGQGVKALGAKNMLAQLTSSPLWENINRALITAEAKVRIAQRKYGKGGSELPQSGGAMNNAGTLWWMERDLQEKKAKYGKK